MRAELLLKHFNRISDAPDAIPRLRQFVLELAVRGKLVEQIASDKPATELLKQIRIERSKRISAGQMKDSEHQPVAPEDEWFQIPESWCWVRLGEIAHVVMGQSPPGETYNTSGEGMPLINGPVEFTEGPFGKTVVNQYTTEPTNTCEEGDLLLCVRGSTTGRTNIAAFKACIGRGVAAIRPLFADQYVRLFIWRLRASIIAMGRGIAFPSVSRQQISDLAVPLPPLSEQHRIVAKAEELMGLCDRLGEAQKDREARRNSLVAASHYHLNNTGDGIRDNARFFINHLPKLTARADQIKGLRQTLLNLATRGKIAPQSAGDEPAADLLRRMRSEKARLLKGGVTSTSQSVSEIEPHDVPFVVPKGWEWVRIGDLLLGDSLNGYSRKPDDAPDGIPILRISAGTLRPDGIVAEEEHKLIGGVTTEHQQKYELQPGDLLACRFNGNRTFVGRLSLYTGYLRIKPIYPDKLIRLRLFSGFALPQLVKFFTDSSMVRKDIERYCATTVGNWGISASNLRTVKIPLPPFAEQQRIVAKLDQLMGLCDRLERELIASQTESNRLLEAVLDDALILSSDEAAISELQKPEPLCVELRV